MSLSPDQVRAVAQLARLDVSDADLARYAGEMSTILELIDRLGSVATDDVVPMAHPLDIVQRLRPDAVTEDNDRDNLQSVAPATEQGCYLVPRVID